MLDTSQNLAIDFVDTFYSLMYSRSHFIAMSECLYVVMFLFIIGYWMFYIEPILKTISLFTARYFGSVSHLQAFYKC